MTRKRRQKALELIRSGEQIIDVADAIGVARQTLYALRKTDPEFAREWDEAADIGDLIQLSECEKEADFRGRLGWLEPKFYEGRVCGFVRKYSDGLLLARLKALAPEKYGDKAKVDAILNSPQGIALEFVSADAADTDTQAL
jgi:DNA-binding XRE family transcriptional regulator